MGDATHDARGLVGRGRELEQLDAALTDAIARRGRLVVVTGEPGIGKTALARAFVERAAQRGASWAWGTCWDGGGAPAYWPWVQIARALARREDVATLRAGLGDAAPWIAGLLPELTSTLGPAATPSDLNADQARFRLFDALVSLLTAVSERRPLVIVLDDLHWSDVSSVLALEFLGRALPDLSILAIAAYRHSEAHARADLASALGGLARTATRLALEGLSRDDVGRLARARAHVLGSDQDDDAGGDRDPGEPAIAPRLLTAVHHASAGNPFFVDELVQLLASQGRLHDDRAAEGPLPLPEGVRDTIRRRLAPLPDDTLRMLRAAAVIGGEFELVTLARVAGERPATILELIDAPLRAGIVTVAGDSGAFVFVHALVRDTLLSALGAAERARLHLLAAEALEQRYRDDVEPHLAQIAHHFMQGASRGGASRAVGYAARAGERAIAQFAYDEAAQLYSHAIEVAAGLPADDRRSWELHHGLGEALIRAGDIEGSRVALDAAIDHARRLDDPQHLAQSALAGALPGFSRGVVDPALAAVLEESLARLDAAEAEDPLQRVAIDALRCRVRVQLATALFWSPQLERREQLVDEAFTLARAIYSGPLAHSSPAQRTLADRTLAFVLAQGFPAVWGPDTVERGLPISVEALELCERTHDAELAMQVRLWRINLLLELDDPVRAEAEIEAYGETARRVRQPRTLVFDPLHRALMANMRGQFDEGRRHTEEAVERTYEVAGSMSQLMADGQRFLQDRMRGRHLDSEAFLRHNADTVPLMRRWRCMLALVLAENGRVEEARRELDQLAVADFQDFPRDAPWQFAMALLAELCTLLHDRPRARLLYDLMAPYEGRNVISLGSAYLGPVARYLGLLAMTIGEAERALGHLETARSAAERTGARPTVVQTALDTAEVLARRDDPGDAERGAALVESVADEATQLGLDGQIARVGDLRTRLAAGRPGRATSRPGTRRVASLRRVREVWTLEVDGRELCLQDAKGLRQLATLLSRPGEPVAATVLNDAGRAGVAPPRGDGAAQAERARVNVTRAVRATLRRIAEHEPEIGLLLQRTIRTGAECMYLPDAEPLIDWEIDA